MNFFQNDSFNGDGGLVEIRTQDFLLHKMYSLASQLFLPRFEITYGAFESNPST